MFSTPFRAAAPAHEMVFYSEKIPFHGTAPNDSGMPVVGPMAHVLLLLHPPFLLLTILLKEREKEPRRIQGVGGENWPAGACQTVPRRVH